MQVLKINRLCTNCLSGGHFKLQCKSVHKCKECQKSHHTLLHDSKKPSEEISVGSNTASLKSDVH